MLKTALPLVAAGLLALGAADARAQAYPWKPERPVTVIVPFIPACSCPGMLQ